MARPSQNLDRALLEAGFAELERGGVRGLSVRAVCARAGVNVRMLNYHFGSKDEFVRQLQIKPINIFSTNYLPASGRTALRWTDWPARCGL